ncbi:hypothetical protein [Novosphingobium humi]|uniref:DUF2283 domain-containing protein n=1 Tax=Novosphingobium humi TaxID=2282397 RepID=A0ABY7U3E2_9SPHN|nr:hypothetical protein [Novosphingobium humi]WCT78869.1 hypothetical protein PQ457_07905 [Novosphingobium humi]
MVAVIYDPASGEILYTVQGSLENINADNAPFVEVAEFRLDYGKDFKVVDGVLVAKEPSQ